MIEIECPKCHTVFEEDESKFAGIIKQVRDKEFQRELDVQARHMEEAKAAAVAEAVARAEQAAQAQSAHKDEELAALRAEMEALKERQRIELEASLAKANARVEALEEQVEREKSAAASELERVRAQAQTASEREKREQAERLVEKELKIQQLEQSISTKEALFENEKKLAVNQVRQELEHERDDYRRKAELAEEGSKRLEALLDEQKRESARAVEQTIAMKNEEIERIKSLRSQLTVKMVGETLEQHCEMEFNKWRSAFPLASFGKDNTVTEHSKGDYVFRDFDADGVEYLSVMFEMKNEEEDSTNKRRNSDHFDKLDRDRKNKGCEYAVLVSTLEKENDFYNQGIVDVSAMSGHERMYVIRPQFFIPLLTFLQSVAQGTLEYRQQIERLKSESIDISYFNQALGEFKVGFGRDYEHASSKLSKAMEGIDKAIKQLESIKESFRLTETHLSRANKKAEDLTIKRLTKNSPLLAERFAEEDAPALEGAVEPDQVEDPGEGDDEG
jgi:hypothetical protein